MDPLSGLVKIHLIVITADSLPDGLCGADSSVCRKARSGSAYGYLFPQMQSLKGGKEDLSIHSFSRVIYNGVFISIAGGNLRMPRSQACPHLRTDKAAAAVLILVSPLRPWAVPALPGDLLFRFRIHPVGSHRKASILPEWRRLHFSRNAPPRPATRTEDPVIIGRGPWRDPGCKNPPQRPLSSPQRELPARRRCFSPPSSRPACLQLFLFQSHKIPPVLDIFISTLPRMISSSFYPLSLPV